MTTTRHRGSARYDRARVRSLAPTRALPLALSCAALAAAPACADNRTFPARDYYDGTGPAPLTCLPNLDGVLAPAELGPTLGVPVSYLVSPPGEERTVDPTGALDADGVRVWDWSVDLASDQVAELTAAPLAGRWYASAFPGGAFVAPADASGSVEGVYSIDDVALWLHGVASAAESPAEGTTLLPYDAPVALYRFPLQEGAAWTSVGTVTGGTFRGIPYAGTDTYDVRVGAPGRLLLPDLAFTQAHPVLVAISIAPAVGVAVSWKQRSFLFECFGEVARATSRLGETADEFTTAVEVRRLGL